MTFVPLLELSSLNGDNGLIIEAEGNLRQLGRAVGGAGDVNGDGIDDFIVGGPRGPSNNYQGQAYVIFGRSDGDFDDFSLAGLNGSNGFEVRGAAVGDVLGTGVSGAGDVNDDGVDDILIAATGADGGVANSGLVYVVFGRSATAFPADLDATAVTGSVGFRILGVNEIEGRGQSLSDVGDVNGDGIDDVIIGAFQVGFDGDPNGRVYVVFGRSTGFANDVSLASLAPSQGFIIRGACSGDTLTTVSDAGDVNGDGIADVIVGAPRNAAHGTHSGAAYVVYGRNGGFPSTVELSALAPSQGFAIHGRTAYDALGISVGAAGDVNGDGFDDVIVGAVEDPIFTSDGPGSAYVVFGRSTPFASPVEASALDGSTGFRIVGVCGGHFVGTQMVAGDHAGTAVSGLGDVNGDQVDDVLIGADWAFPSGFNGPGAAYVVFGRTDGFAATIQLSALDGGDGFAMRGAGASGFTGNAVSGIGDVNGDGDNDALVGAFTYSPGGATAAGRAYVIFGGPPLYATVDAFDEDTGADDGVTSDTSLTVSGTATAGTIVHVFRDGDEIGTTTAGGDGTWSFADPTTLTPGEYAYTAQSEDEDENLGDLSAALDVEVVDAPIVTITGIDEDTGTPGDGVTTDRYLTFEGTAAPNAVVRLFRDGGDLGTVLADPDGNWSFADTVILPNGAFAYTATASSGAGDAETEAPFVATVVTAPSASFYIPVELSEPGGADRLVIEGAASGHFSGRSVSDAGDVNGDGIDDLIVGAYGANDLAGAAYLIFGGYDGLPATIELSAFALSQGIEIRGEDAGDLSGKRVRGAGDVNGDAVDDVLVGAQGRVYVVFGSSDGFDGPIDLSALGSGGFEITGEGVDTIGVGTALFGAGDVNDDGIDDIVVGAPGANAHGAGSGRAYVIFGRADPDAVLALSAFDANDGFILNGGSAGDEAGVAVSGLGDVNGDQIDDLIIGARFADVPGRSNAGAAYVVFGHSTGFDFTYELAALGVSNGFILRGENANDYAGSGVGWASDVNGDGINDILIGAGGSDRGGFAAGTTYVVFGRTGSFGSLLELSVLQGSNGFAILGDGPGSFTGTSSDGAGDLNGDGYFDLVIGAYGADPDSKNQAGAAYVVYGRGDEFAPSLALGDLNGENGFAMHGDAALDNAGIAASWAGDLNDDGYYDVVVGAWHADPNGASSGESYVIYGRPTPSLSLAFSSDTGIRGDGVTTDQTLTIHGTGTPGATVHVFRDGDTTEIGTATVGGDGRWSFADPATLSIDAHYYEALATDDYGHQQDDLAGPALVLVVDTPTAAVTGITDDTGTSGDGITTDTTLTVAGTATASAHVEVYRDGASIGTTEADGDGNWAFEDPTTLALDDYVYTAIADDGFGHLSAESDEFGVSVIALPATTITGFSDDTGTPGDGITADRTLTISGTTAAFTTVTVQRDGSTVGTTVSLADGTWSLADPASLANDAYDYTAFATVAGHTGPTSSTLTVQVVDLGAAITGFTTDTGTPGDRITTDTTLTVSGTAGGSATVHVYRGASEIGTTMASAGGAWSFADPATLAAGLYPYRAQAEDENQDLGPLSAAFDIRVVNPPGTATVTAFSEDTGTVGDGVTTDRTLTVSGTAGPGNRVHVVRDGVEIGTTTASGTGNWSFADPATQSAGQHVYRARADDGAGHLGAQSAGLEVFVVDAGATPGNGPDMVIGTSAANVIQGVEGNDTIFGEAGNDTVRGGNGSDSLLGGEGSDRLEGGNDADTARGGDANDSVYGENGNDRLYGENGNDRIEAGAGADRADGGAGADTLYGGADNDTLFGDQGADQLFGEAGVDWLHPGLDNVRDSIVGTLAQLAGDTIEGFVDGVPTVPGADVVLVQAMTNAQRLQIDGDILDAQGRLFLPGGGALTFLGHAGAEVDAVNVAGGVQIWLV